MRFRGRTAAASSSSASTTDTKSRGGSRRPAPTEGCTAPKMQCIFWVYENVFKTAEVVQAEAGMGHSPIPAWRHGAAGLTPRACQSLGIAWSHSAGHHDREGRGQGNRRQFTLRRVFCIATTVELVALGVNPAKAGDLALNSTIPTLTTTEAAASSNCRGRPPYWSSPRWPILRS